MGSADAGRKSRLDAGELAEEELCIGERTAGGGVGGDGLDGAQGMRRFQDQLDGANVVERSDGAAGNDGELGREGGDGDEAEVGAAFEQVDGALGGLGVVEGEAGGEVGVCGRMLKVPHERRGIKKIDRSNA